jgi:hypothetical protein
MSSASPLQTFRTDNSTNKRARQNFDTWRSTPLLQKPDARLPIGALLPHDGLDYDDIDVEVVHNRARTPSTAPLVVDTSQWPSTPRKRALSRTSTSPHTRARTGSISALSYSSSNARPQTHPEVDGESSPKTRRIEPPSSPATPSFGAPSPVDGVRGVGQDSSDPDVDQDSSDSTITARRSVSVTDDSAQDGRIPIAAPSIILHAKSSPTFSLFTPPPSADEPPLQSVLFVDQHELFEQPISQIFAALRESRHFESLTDHSELVLSIEDLGLKISEVRRPFSFTSSYGSSRLPTLG